jgi:hypothetical protein
MNYRLETGVGGDVTDRSFSQVSPWLYLCAQLTPPQCRCRFEADLATKSSPTLPSLLHTRTPAANARSRSFAALSLSRIRLDKLASLLAVLFRWCSSSSGSAGDGACEAR